MDVLPGGEVAPAGGGRRGLWPPCRIGLPHGQRVVLPEEPGKLGCELREHQELSAELLTPDPEKSGGLDAPCRHLGNLCCRTNLDFSPPESKCDRQFFLNVDKDLDQRFRLHTQLSTGPLNNGLTNDQDFAGTVIKHPFSLAEAYIDFHPHSNFSIRGGRMEEVFADNTRFLWDDDVRFNGFQQLVKLPFDSNNSLELRAGEYFFSNPNIVILSATSPYVGAGFQPGQKVRGANLFHPGAVLNLGSGGGWKHQLIADVQVYRNPNQIQLASLADGFPLLVSNAIGLALSGPITGTGNATTAPGSATYFAPDFHIVRASYRIERGVKIADREMPLWFHFQLSRNYGAGRLNDALMGTVNLGAVKRAGDLRFLYQYAIKEDLGGLMVYGRRTLQTSLPAG